MTPNQKELLGYFKNVGKANVVTMSRKIDLSIDYTRSLCNDLVEKGYLEKISTGKFPTYRFLKEKKVG